MMWAVQGDAWIAATQHRAPSPGGRFDAPSRRDRSSEVGIVQFVESEVVYFY